MRHVTRLAGICLSLILFQLVLVEGGFGCRATDPGGAAAVASTTMPMPGHSAGMDMTGGSGRDGQPPCRFPWAPDGCQSMAPCAPPALVSARIVLAQGALAPTNTPVLTVHAPISPTRQPELPPPRA